MSYENNYTYKAESGKPNDSKIKIWDQTLVPDTRKENKLNWVIPPGWDTICDGVNCYIRKCTIYYPWLWLLINIVVISYWRWRDWFHSNLKNNCECALIIKDNRWYIYGCNNWHRHKSCPNLVEWPNYEISIQTEFFSIQIHNQGLLTLLWFHFSKPFKICLLAKWLSIFLNLLKHSIIFCCCTTTPFNTLWKDLKGRKIGLWYVCSESCFTFQNLS